MPPLSMGRFSLYSEPKGENAETLVLMRRIYELYLKYPLYGARRMVLQVPLATPRRPNQRPGCPCESTGTPHGASLRVTQGATGSRAPSCGLPGQSPSSHREAQYCALIASGLLGPDSFTRPI